MKTRREFATICCLVISIAVVGCDSRIESSPAAPPTSASSVREEPEPQSVSATIAPESAPTTTMRQQSVRTSRKISDMVMRAQLQTAISSSKAGAWQLSEHFPPLETGNGIVVTRCNPDEPFPCVFVVDEKDPWEVGCDVDWKGRCEGVQTLEPPPGWEICNFILAETSRNKGGSWAFMGANSKGIKIKVKANGSANPLDQWGGWVWVRVTAWRLFSTEANEEQREQLKCNYNPDGGGKGGGRFSEEAFCAANPKDPGSSIGVQMCMDYVMEDGRKKVVSAPYACGVCGRF